MPRDDDSRTPPVGELDSDERAALVRKRRVWRRIKAAGAIVVGLGAGTFLACYSAIVQTPVRTIPPDRRAGPDPPDAGPPTDAGAMDAAVPAAPTFPPWPTSRSDAAVGVDVDEHRRGMPVPDNLLE